MVTSQEALQSAHALQEAKKAMEATEATQLSLISMAMKSSIYAMA